MNVAKCLVPGDGPGKCRQICAALARLDSLQAKERLIEAPRHGRETIISIRGLLGC